MPQELQDAQEPLEQLCQKFVISIISFSATKKASCCEKRYSFPSPFL
ncbi:MAG: hypothetical protein ACOX3T_00085 [Bdellovibrionota bacterium]